MVIFIAIVDRIIPPPMEVYVPEKLVPRNNSGLSLFPPSDEETKGDANATRDRTM
jgi:hypothetical protein